MFFVSFLCGVMLLSVYIYENVFLYLCTAHWATMVVLICAIEIKRKKIMTH